MDLEVHKKKWAWMPNLRVFFFLHSSLHTVATFQELSLPNRLHQTQSPCCCSAQWKVTPNQGHHTGILLTNTTVKWTSPQEFTNETTGWGKKADAQWKQCRDQSRVYAWLLNHCYIWITPLQTQMWKSKKEKHPVQDMGTYKVSVL